MKHHNELQSLSDDELLRRLANLLSQSRRVEADLIAHIGEVDHRRLWAREACSSMFKYATEVLHLSEAESYFRIAVARAARKHPVLLTMLGDGRLHLSGIALLASHLTDENRESVLARATHKSKRQIEELAAELSPKPDVPAVIRKLPTPSPTRRSNSVRKELRLPRAPVLLRRLHLRWSSRSDRTVTECSSPRALSFATSSSACKRSWERTSRPSSRLR